MTGIRALFVGDVSWDTTVVADRIPAPDEKVVTREFMESAGGVVANASIACALAQSNVTLMSTIADDVAGDAVRAFVLAQGIDANFEVTDGVTTRAVIILDPHGEKRLYLIPGAHMYPSVKAVESMSLDGIGWVHTALYDYEASARLVERCRGASIPWSIDLEPASIPKDPAMLARHISGCRTVIVNARASAELGLHGIDILLQLGAEEVIETLGADGARLHMAENRSSITARPEMLRVPVIDTTGAGDAFAGWYVAERLRGATQVVALERAVAAATLSVSKLGASASYPSRADVIAS